MMNKGKSLLKNTLIISIGKVCTSFITFLLLPLYTNVLSTSEYGVVDLINTLTFLLVPVVTLQLEQAVFRNLIECRGDKKKQTQIISTGIIQLTFHVFSILILFLVLYIFIKSEYKTFLIINLVSYIFCSFFLQIARGIGKTTTYAFGSFLSALLIIIFNVLFIVIFDFGAYGMLLGYFLGYFLVSIYLFFNIKIYNFLKISSYKKDILHELLRYSVPLVPNSLSWWIFNSSDRLIVSSILSVAQNGILSASLKFSTIITTLYNIFDTSWIESVSVNINDDDFNEYFNNIFNIVFNLFACMCLVLISCMPIIFPIMINDNYKLGYGLVPISIIAALFNVIQGLVAVIYAAKKDTKSIAKTSMTAALINIFIHLICIRFIGLYAAVVSTLVSFAILAIYRLVVVNKKYFKIHFDKRIYMLFILFTISIIIYYTNNIYLSIFSIFINVLYSFISNKNYISYFYELFMNKLLKKKGSNLNESYK